jgi:WD40 repeat protein
MRFSGFKQTKFVLKPTFVGELNSFVCSGSEDSMIYIWDAENGDLLQKIAGHSGVVNSVRWTDCNGGMLLSASDDGTIRLWRFKQDVVVDTRNEG